ncbi:MAG: hypothetical protein GYB65_18790, partial [Chloroflexi bacterium]|nr:hypothetical protein [Chloroflexota bacterium]
MHARRLMLLVVVAVLAVSTVGLAAPVKAQGDDPQLDVVYDDPNGLVTFMYPAGWQVLLDTEEAVIVTSDESFDGVAGDFMIAAFKSSEYVPSLAGQSGTPYELLQIDAQAASLEGLTYSTVLQHTLR